MARSTARHHHPHRANRQEDNDADTDYLDDRNNFLYTNHAWPGISRRFGRRKRLYGKAVGRLLSWSTTSR
jgi:hypothetical protein